MRKGLSLALSVMALGMAASSATAGTDVSVNINGYLPAPPGVHVAVAGGRPYYRDSGRIVYLEREEHHHKGKRGHAYGHRKHEGDHGKHGHGHGRHD
jgi:hypothetical protein